MDTIIGLGQAGCNIADYFAQYKQYKIYKIDDQLSGYKKDGIYDMPWQCNAEEYESRCPDMKNFFKNVTGEILFVLAGSGNVSGLALRILEHVKHCKINVLYIQPDIELLPERRRALERSTYYILQEYARSGIFKRLFLISNTTIEEHLGDIPLVGYYDKINEMVVSSIHMINVYGHLKSITDTFCDPHETARISTFGLVDVEDGSIKLFFPLDKVREMRYYYAINKEKLETDGALFKKIKQQIKDKSKEGIKTNYGIFSTNYEENYAYTECYSSSIQVRQNDKNKMI